MPVFVGSNGVGKKALRWARTHRWEVGSVIAWAFLLALALKVAPLGVQLGFTYHTPPPRRASPG
jgi:hypothetical protein